MKLTSKELIIIFVESTIALIIGILFSKIDFLAFNSIFRWILLFLLVAIIVAFIFGIIYRRIGEIDKALECQEIKQIELEEKLKRTEQLVDIKADIKDIQRRLNNG